VPAEPTEPKKTIDLKPMELDDVKELKKIANGDLDAEKPGSVSVSVTIGNDNGNGNGNGSFNGNVTGNLNSPSDVARSAEVVEESKVRKVDEDEDYDD